MLYFKENSTTTNNKAILIQKYFSQMNVLTDFWNSSSLFPDIQPFFSFVLFHF